MQNRNIRALMFMLLKRIGLSESNMYNYCTQHIVLVVAMIHTQMHITSFEQLTWENRKKDHRTNRETMQNGRPHDYSKLQTNNNQENNRILQFLLMECGHLCLCKENPLVIVCQYLFKKHTTFAVYIICD